MNHRSWSDLLCVTFFPDPRQSEICNLIFWLFFFFLDTERRLHGRLCCCHIVQSRLLSLSSFSGRTNSWFDLQQGMVIVSDDCRYKNGQETKWFMGKVRCVQTKLQPLLLLKVCLTRLSVLIILFRIFFDMIQFAKMYLQTELRNREVGDVDGFFFLLIVTRWTGNTRRCLRVWATRYEEALTHRTQTVQDLTLTVSNLSSSQTKDRYRWPPYVSQ